MTALTIDQIHKLRDDIGEKELAEIRSHARALLPLAAIRECAEVTQSEMAKRLGTSQAAVSKFEGRGDFLLSTLYRYVQAVGGEVNVSIKTMSSIFELTAQEYDEEVAFSLSKCKAKEDLSPLVQHARQYSAVQAQNRIPSLKRWTRPKRRASEEALLSFALGE